MARIITVHGTFAKWEVSPGGEAARDEIAGPPALQWWEPGSAFDRDIKSMVSGEDGPVEVEAFEWSSANSERDRRAAATGLLERVKQLEADGEPYSLVGHSHGGSVISTMLVRAAARGVALPNMRRWITVGTPFVELRKERFLFSRLPLLLKAVYVASLMLLVMFLAVTVADVIDGVSPFADVDATKQFLTSLTLTALPFLVFYAGVGWHQKRNLFFYRPGTVAKARKAFASRWLPLLHEDDEVVSGLGSLDSVKLNFFQDNFAVSGLTLASVFVLPLIYIMLLNSPKTMVWIADVLKTKVYDIKRFETVEPFYKHDRSKVRTARRKLRAARERMNRPLNTNDERTIAQSQVEILKNELRNTKEEVRTTYRENAVKNERALRFKEKFLQKADGTDCRRGKLCRRGRSLRINSRLLFHLVTDEVSRVVVDEDIPTGTIGGIVNFIAPILLVPFVFIAVSIALVKIMQLVAGLISRFASNRLDALTWAQVRRTALGNDTEAEVAVAAISRPYWIDNKHTELPKSISDAITDYANNATSESLSKFRNAISELAFAEQGAPDQGNILKFFTWRELVHAAYFEVPEFRKLIAVALTQPDGFKPTQAANEDESLVALGTYASGMLPVPPVVEGRAMASFS